MPKTMQVGYIVLALLGLSAFVVVAAALVFDTGIGQALLLLAIADVVIIFAGWRMAKRAAATDKRGDG